MSCFSFRFRMQNLHTQFLEDCLGPIDGLPGNLVLPSEFFQGGGGPKHIEAADQGASHFPVIQETFHLTKCHTHAGGNHIRPGSGLWLHPRTAGCKAHSSTHAFSAARYECPVPRSYRFGPPGSDPRCAP